LAELLSTVLIGGMRRICVTFVCVLALALVAGLALLWTQTPRKTNEPKQSQAQRPTNAPKRWLVVSSPVFGSRASSNGVIPTFSFAVSNASLRTLELRLPWFECRAKAGLDVVAEQKYLPLPMLAPRAATTLTFDLPEGSRSGQECLCCLKVSWFERGSYLRRKAEEKANSNDPMDRLFDIDWTRPWRGKRLANGVKFASNIGVAEYFRVVYGMDAASYERRMKEFEAQRRLWEIMQSSTNAVPSGPGYVRFPTPDEKRTNDAWLHFADFYRSTLKATNIVSVGTSRSLSNIAPGGR
jgi:hypothetical protein